MAEFIPPFDGMPDENGLVRISGSIEHIIYFNEENGYSICDMGTDDDELITIVGTMPFLCEGEQLVVYGKWVHNPKYGRQFSVQNYEKVLPADVNSILRYLASGAVKGIGPKMATRIVEAYGEDSFDVIENHPDWLAEIKGISRNSAQKISEANKLVYVGFAEDLVDAGYSPCGICNPDK